jgi:hypothetical protein
LFLLRQKPAAAAPAPPLVQPAVLRVLQLLLLLLLLLVLQVLLVLHCYSPFVLGTACCCCCG